MMQAAPWNIGIQFCALTMPTLTGFLPPASCGSGALPPGKKDLIADTRFPAMPPLADGASELAVALSASSCPVGNMTAYTNTQIDRPRCTRRNLATSQIWHNVT